MPKVFDAHVHLSERKDDALIPYARRNGLKYTLPELLGLMEEHSVSSACLLSPPLEGGGPLPNAEVLKLCKRSRDALSPVLTVEPSSESVRSALALSRSNRGTVAGFKVRLGYVEVFAGDSVFSPLYDYAEEESLPVLYHTGDTARSDGSLLHSHPLTLDPVADSRPDLTIVACHFGNPWIEEVGELIYKHERLFTDVSGLVVGGSKYAEEYVDWLSAKISAAIHFSDGGGKVLFGTDYPVTTYPTALGLVGKLAVDAQDRERILGGNFRQVFTHD